MMQTIDVIHTNGGYTTLRCPTAEAYGVMFGELCGNEDYRLDSIHGHGSVFREKEEEE